MSHTGRPTRNDPYPLVSMLIRSNVDVWEEYVRHDFVEQLGRGTLSRESFIHFLKCATTVLTLLLTKVPLPTDRIIFISNITPEHMGMAVPSLWAQTDSGLCAENLGFYTVSWLLNHLRMPNFRLRQRSSFPS